MQKTNWLELANSKNAEERLAALDYACEHSEDYQKELLFWYLRSDMAIQPELLCYQALGAEYRELVDANISEVPYRFSAKIEAPTDEAWVRLASSDNAENRMLALEIAKGNPANYQNLLRLWFVFNDLILPRNNKARWVIYRLLDEEQMNKLEPRYQTETPPLFDPEGSFPDFAEEDNPCWQALVEMLKHYQNFSKIVFVKIYRNISFVSLKEAKDVADKLKFW
jgi:hypothetical protein